MLPSGSFRIAEPPFEAFLDDIACLGVRPVPARAPGHAYAIVKGRSNARWWVVPTHDMRATLAGLQLLRPMNFSARLAKGLSLVLIRAGLTRLWARRRITFDALPAVPCPLQEMVEACAYFTGTNGPHRKSVIQMMGRQGIVTGYVKISRAPAVRACLRNEARFLHQVRALGMRSVIVPTCIALKDAEDHTLLVTDSAKAGFRREPKALGDAHLRFLRELSTSTFRADASVAMAELTLGCDQLAAHLPTAWGARFARGIGLVSRVLHQIPTCMAHGDFTPWNSFIQGAELYVYDWEYGRDAYPVGYDMAHFLISSAMPRPPAGFVADLIRCIEKEVRAPPVECLLFSLLLHARFYIHRAIAGHEPVHAWVEEPVYSHLVDSLLSHGCAS